MTMLKVSAVHLAERAVFCQQAGGAALANVCSSSGKTHRGADVDVDDGGPRHILPQLLLQLCIVDLAGRQRPDLHSDRTNEISLRFATAYLRERDSLELHTSAGGLTQLHGSVKRGACRLSATGQLFSRQL